MKQKNEYKEINWLFNRAIKIPKDWRNKSINEIFTFLRTATNSRSDLKISGDIMYVHYGDIHQKWNYVLDCASDVIPYIDRDKVQKASKLKNGDLIIADASEDHEGSGTSVLIKNVSDKQVVAGLHTIVLRDNSGITDLNFRAYITSSKLIKIQIISYVTGISVYGLSKTNLGVIQVPIPPLVEQQKIASILSRVDALIEMIQKTIEKTERLKKGLMQLLLTKGIDHSKFKKVKWLFGKQIKIPEEWEIKQLISLSSTKPEYGSGDAALPHDLKLPRYIRITDIDDAGRLKDENVSVILTDNKQYVLKQDDFLFARTGSVGRTFLFSIDYGLCVYAGYLIRFKLDKRKILPIFLHHYTHSNNYWVWLVSELTQGVQPNVNAQQYSRLPIILPPLSEQTKIASILSGVDAYIQKNQEYKKKLEELKKGMMQKLLTGQIRVKT